MSKKIGWQKYEDMIKKQISSPLASLMMTANLDLNLETEEEDEIYQEELEQALESQEILAVPVPN